MNRDTGHVGPAPHQGFRGRWFQRRTVRFVLDNAVAGLRQALRRDAAVPVHAQWTAPKDYAFPATFDCSRFPGLIHCALVMDDSGTARVITYWRSHDHLRKHSARFVAAAGLKSRDWDGSLIELRSSTKVYTPTSFLDGVLKLSALIGAVAVCYQAYLNLLAAPEVSVAVETAQPINASPNSTVSIPFSLTNHAGSAAARVELLDITASVPNTGIDSGEMYFDLDPGKRVEAHLTGHTGDAAEVRFRMTARAKAGRFRVAHDIPVTADVKVWPALDYGRFEVLTPECGAEQCVARALLHVGRSEANGFDCWARIVGVADVTMRAVRTSNDGGTPAVSGSGAGRVAKIDWHESAADAFRDRHVDLVMAGKVSQNSWPSIANKVNWLCDPITRTGGA